MPKQKSLDPKKIRIKFEDLTGAEGGYSVEMTLDRLVRYPGRFLRGLSVAFIAYGDVHFDAALEIPQDEDIESCVACHVMTHPVFIDSRGLCGLCSPGEPTPDECAPSRTAGDRYE